jgi:membrane complex biogenesis BtpA family protein
MPVREWDRRRVLIGVVGAPPLPGSYGYAGATLEELERRVVSDATAYAQAGFDALMIQNIGDIPAAERVGPETVAWMTTLGRAVRAVIDVPLGVAVLKSDGPAALAIAQAIGADFVRVKVWVGAMVGAEGLVQGSAREVLHYRRHIGAEQIAIWADVHDRTGVPLAPMPLERAAREAIVFGKADGLVITGADEDETVDWIDRVKQVLPDTLVVAGGGAHAGNLGRILAGADGVIVATAAKVEGVLSNPVDPAAARGLVAAARAARGAPE